jgi:hypothetical protein
MSAEAKTAHTPVAYRVAAIPNMKWHFCLKREEADHLVKNYMTYVNGVTGTIVEPLYTSPQVDTRLTAAASDLLDGCKAVIGLVQLICSRDDLPETIREAIQASHRLVAARAAISKAESLP